MRRGPIETSIGVVVVLLAVIFVVVAYNATDYRGESGYRLLAEFNKVGTIKTGSDVRVSGVPVGKVLGLSLDPETFKAEIILDIDNRFLFPDDTIAIIGNEGLLGGHFVELLPGASDMDLQPGDTVEFTQDSVDMLQLLGKFMFSAAGGGNKDGKN